jgi:N-6 DNA Methylase
LNAVEIEEELLKLTGEPFDAAQFPFQFLLAFGHKDTTIRKLRSGNSNVSDVSGGVLLRNHIHLAIANPGEVSAKLLELKTSPKTVSAKAKFVLATDGEMVEVEELGSGDVIASPYSEMAAKCFGMLLPLAGITTVREIQNNPIDIRATGRLNRLYLELLKENPEWEKAERRHDLNQFMSRLIFCLFAEDTGIFYGEQTFTATLTQMSTAENTHEVIGELFRAMDTKPEDRLTKKIKSWADVFPFVNGGLFDGNKQVPRFSKIARAYLLQAGSLDWKLINPDIFGSMIQAVADDDERGELGMHYTSVPNILKVLNPLFLDDLREQLAQAGDNGRKLLNLRRRMATIRVFDPACGSGNFLVIAYIQMREIEAEIIRRRRDDEKKSSIKLANFYGIEIKDFAVEIARLALLIAEFQCDVRMIGQQEARSLVLPLKKTGQITCGNALRLDWLQICPPAKPVEHQRKDLFDDVPEQLEVDFDAVEPETYICGNPPYKGNAKKSDEQKDDLDFLLTGKIEKWGLLDYVCGWFFKAFEYAKHSKTQFAFVATNSIAQGQHVANFWKTLFDSGLKFAFAVRSFKWSNLATNDAGVTVVCIGASLEASNPVIYDGEIKQRVENINGYLLAQKNYWVSTTSTPISNIARMVKGNYYGLSEHLIFDGEEKAAFLQAGLESRFLRKFYGSTEVINAKPRNCLWFENKPDARTLGIRDISARISSGATERSKSKDAVSNGMAQRPHQFREMNAANWNFMAIPVVSSENRNVLPIELLDNSSIISNKCFALYDAPLWNLALVASRIHWVWIGTVCVRLEMRFSYSNTLGWNTFPVPPLTEKNKSDLTRCAEDILLAREAHWPATIADLYDPDAMPEDLKAAHDRNDETLERIYIGRRFRNDTERLEKLFDMYTKMTADKGAAPAKAIRKAKKQ